MTNEWKDINPNKLVINQVMPNEAEARSEGSGWVTETNGLAYQVRPYDKKWQVQVYIVDSEKFQRSVLSGE